MRLAGLIGVLALAGCAATTTKPQTTASKPAATTPTKWNADPYP